MRPFILCLALFSTLPAHAQQAPPPASAPSSADSPGEFDKLKNSCLSFTFKGVPGCAEELFTGQPVHIAVGSIAPQNGFGAGLAYVGHWTTTNWRNSWDADAVGSNNGSWRAGLYVKLVDTHQGGITGGFGTPPPRKKNRTDLPEYPVVGLYAQVISLNKITYFGLGPASPPAGRAFFGMTETIGGGNVAKPFSSSLRAALYGEINGRFVTVHPAFGQGGPSIGQLYSEATAPGLTSQPGTLQFGEGLRIRPVFGKDAWRLNYDASYQQYVTTGSAHFSFQRLTFDLGHEFAIYAKTTQQRLAREANGPDNCATDAADKPAKCPPPFTRDFEGTVGFRVLTMLSMTPGANVVPFYFQPTLGGADINGNPALPSYQDYRFRAPDLLLLHESFEHSIWNLPVGFALTADEAKLALTRGGLGSSPWLHSFSAGLTLHAGGFPQFFLLFAWGGPEGTHTIANLNTSLLGASTRPSLF